MSHICLANLLETEIKTLNKNQLLISLELLDEFSQFIIFDTTGPVLLKRLGSIRNYPTIEERKSLIIRLKKIKTNNFLPPNFKTRCKSIN